MVAHGKWKGVVGAKVSRWSVNLHAKKRKSKWNPASKPFGFPVYGPSSISGSSESKKIACRRATRPAKRAAEGPSSARHSRSDEPAPSVHPTGCMVQHRRIRDVEGSGLTAARGRRCTSTLPPWTSLGGKLFAHQKGGGPVRRPRTLGIISVLRLGSGCLKTRVWVHWGTSGRV